MSVPGCKANREFSEVFGNRKGKATSVRYKFATNSDRMWNSSFPNDGHRPMSPGRTPDGC